MTKNDKAITTSEDSGYLENVGEKHLSKRERKLLERLRIVGDPQDQLEKFHKKVHWWAVKHLIELR